MTCTEPHCRMSSRGPHTHLEGAMHLCGLLPLPLRLLNVGLRLRRHGQGHLLLRRRRHHSAQLVHLSLPAQDADREAAACAHRDLRAATRHRRGGGQRTGPACGSRAGSGRDAPAHTARARMSRRPWPAAAPPFRRGELLWRREARPQPRPQRPPVSTPVRGRPPSPAGTSAVRGAGSPLQTAASPVPAQRRHKRARHASPPGCSAHLGRESVQLRRRGRHQHRLAGHVRRHCQRVAFQLQTRAHQLVVL